MDLTFQSQIKSCCGETEEVTVHGFVDYGGKPQVIVNDIDDVMDPLLEVTAEHIKVLRGEYIFRAINKFKKVNSNVEQ
jgi:hypothetical protein